MPAAFSHIDWPKVYRDYLRSKLSLRIYRNSPRFRQFCKDRVPGVSTLSHHFRQLAQQKQANASAPASLPVAAKEVSVVKLSERQIEDALRSRGNSQTVRPRPAVVEKPVCFRFPGGATLEFFTASPELLAMQALRVTAGGAA